MTSPRPSGRRTRLRPRIRPITGPTSRCRRRGAAAGRGRGARSPRAAACAADTLTTKMEDRPMKHATDRELGDALHATWVAILRERFPGTRWVRVEQEG